MDQNKRKLKVDLEDLCFAQEDSSYEHDHFLDLQTGELIFISDYMDSEESERLCDQIDEAPDRYEPLPKADSHEGYRDMEDFISTVRDDRLRERLEVAINGKVAFSRFRDVLTLFPSERERWFRFKDDRLKDRALEWLESIGVEPT